MNTVNRYGVLMSILISLCCVSSVQSAELGDPAAPLKIEKWVKGDPVDFESKKVLVVEFWATWCGPCRTSIPHLTELQEKYKNDVVFIGVSDEPAATVAPYVKEMGDKMNYTVAVDKNRKTHDGYMKAYDQNGIPTAFIVDKNRNVAWLGHPMADLDNILSQVIEGTYDIQLAKRAMKAEQNLPKYFDLVKAGDDSDARTLGDEILKHANKNAGLLNQFAWFILTMPDLPDRDLELAMEVAQAAYDASKGNSAMIADTYARAFYELGNLEKAIHYQQKALDMTDEGRMRDDLMNTLAQYKKEQQ